MGAWLLILHLTLDGSSSVMQERFATKDLCEKGEQHIRHGVGGDWGVSVKSHVCIYTGVGEE